MAKEKSKVVSGETYIFVKSGNKVKTLEQTGTCEWKVERIDTGKGMIVRESALILVEDWENLGNEE